MCEVIPPTRLVSHLTDSFYTNEHITSELYLYHLRTLSRENFTHLLKYESPAIGISTSMLVPPPWLRHCCTSMRYAFQEFSNAV